jgi:flagellar motor protein MotB
MFRPLLSLIAVSAVLGVQAQSSGRFTQENGDCTGAIMIADSVFRAEHPVRGFGNKLEIKENPSDHKQWFEREHHTTWYKFRVPVKCELTMDIIPDNPADDIDFIIFEGAIPGICDKIANKQVTPVRSNISRNNPSLGSRCGLSKDATDYFVRSGVGASYSRALEVEAGQLFYLVIDHQHPPKGGYEIRFHYDPPPPSPVEEVEEEKVKRKQRLLVDVVDDRTGAPVEATLAIEGITFNKVVEAQGRSSYSFEMEPYRNVKIGCTRKGYMFRTVKVKGSIEPELRVEVRLTPIAPGEQVVLDDIRFVGNADQVMRESEAALLLLLRFMQDNPNVRIEVQGHVNGPTFKNKKEFIELSTARAKTVYDFLLVNDIEPDRISYVGLGNSQMLFPDPKTKEQSDANRRVEVKVMGL